jgi:hypothetical protein
MAPGLRLARGLGFCLSHLLRAVLTNSNEKKDPIPQRNYVKRKKNTSCILPFVAKRILGNGIFYLDLRAA